MEKNTNIENVEEVEVTMTVEDTPVGPSKKEVVFGVAKKVGKAVLGAVKTATMVVGAIVVSAVAAGAVIGASGKHENDDENNSDMEEDVIDLIPADDSVGDDELADFES